MRVCNGSIATACSRRWSSATTPRPPGPIPTTCSTPATSTSSSAAPMATTSSSPASATTRSMATAATTASRAATATTWSRLAPATTSSQTAAATTPQGRGRQRRHSRRQRHQSDHRRSRQDFIITGEDITEVIRRRGQRLHSRRQVQRHRWPATKATTGSRSAPRTALPATILTRSEHDAIRRQRRFRRRRRLR